MKIIACDDDKIILQILEQWTKEYLKDKIYRFYGYDNGIDLLNRLESDNFEEPIILFMDIKLKNDNGIQIAKLINTSKKNAAMIFISGYTEYLEDSFEADPVFFLVKPLKKEKFEIALEKAILKTQQKERKYILAGKKDVKKIFIDEIYYAESKARIMHLHCAFGDVQYYEKMDLLEEKLAGDFVRCHKSFLVNLKHVRSIEGKEILLMSGMRIPISRINLANTKKAIFEYLGGQIL